MDRRREEATQVRQTHARGGAISGDQAYETCSKKLAKGRGVEDSSNLAGNSIAGFLGEEVKGSAPRLEDAWKMGKGRAKGVASRAPWLS